MHPFIGGLLALLGLGGFLWGCAGLIAPRLVGLGSRGRACLVLIAAISLAGILGEMDVPPPPETAESVPVQRESSTITLPDGTTVTRAEWERSRQAYYEQQARLDEAGQDVPAESPRFADAPQSARPYLSRIQGDLGTPMESILSQMPDGMIPTRDRRGEDRVFTYTFGDGSEMILVFRPSGNQTGLELYMVDVRD